MIGSLKNSKFSISLLHRAMFLVAFLTIFCCIKNLNDKNSHDRVPSKHCFGDNGFVHNPFNGGPHIKWDEQLLICVKFLRNFIRNIFVRSRIQLWLNFPSVCVKLFDKSYKYLVDMVEELFTMTLDHSQKQYKTSSAKLRMLIYS